MSLFSNFENKILKIHQQSKTKKQPQMLLTPIDKLWNNVLSSHKSTKCKYRFI